MPEEPTNSEKNKIEIEPLSPEAKDFYEKTFRPKYLKVLEEIAKIRLFVLVWGPGPKGGKVYEKRIQILNELRGQPAKHAALLSEEIDSLDPAPDFPTNVRERIQAQQADLLVVLQSSPGSIGEVHDIAADLQIASKMLIFIDERHMGGYSATGALSVLKGLYNNVRTYNESDLERCVLLEEVRRQVQLRQIARFLAHGSI